MLDAVCLKLVSLEKKFLRALEFRLLLGNLVESAAFDFSESHIHGVSVFLR